MSDLQAAAGRFHSLISEPRFETSPAEVEQAATNAINRFNAALDAIGHRKPEEATFTNTLTALDQAHCAFSVVRNRLWLLQNASTNESVRIAVSRAAHEFAKAAVDAGYRQDIYAAIKSVAKSEGEALKDQDRRLLRLCLEGFKRNGLELNPEQQDQLRVAWKQLVQAHMQFLSNLSGPAPRVRLKRAELKGVTEKFLRQECTVAGQDEYWVPANSYLGDFRFEQTRKRLWLANQNSATTQNLPLAQLILELRQSIARQLGYSSWAEYETRGTLAGSPAAARAFCEDLNSRLKSKFDAQIAELEKIKVRETGDPNARIELWDIPYYEMKRSKYRRRRSALASYFPAGHVLDGMFDVWERVMRLKIEPVQPSGAWADTVRLFAISDARSGEPLGLVYFDLYARTGKRNDSFTKTVTPGGRTADGFRQCPVSAVELGIYQYPKGVRFSLFPNTVETLYHEFGHALHEVLCRSQYFALEGNSVSRDYVEVPSELFEMWAFDRDALDVLTHRNPKYLRQMLPKHYDWLKAELAETAIASHYWTTALALTDLTLNTDVREGVDAIALSNRVLSEHYLPWPADAALITSFGNWVEYGAAMYSHVWCEAIAADLLTQFEQAPGGLLDPDVGVRLRREIFETGDVRPPKVSLEKFLGRPYSTDAFFKRQGLELPSHTR